MRETACSRARLSKSATVTGELLLELKAANDRAGALAGGACLRNDGAVAAAVQPLAGARSEYRGSGREVPQGNHGQLHPIKDIGEFQADIQARAFLMRKLRPKLAFSTGMRTPRKERMEL